LAVAAFCCAASVGSATFAAGADVPPPTSQISAPDAPEAPSVTAPAVAAPTGTAPVGKAATATAPVTPAPAASAPAATVPVSGPAAKFKKMSLDELMNVEVTSVAKRESTVGQSPAAIFVVSQEDIRRSGATSIPEALRSVPGLEVAQTNSNNWAISARGFNSTGANKLLVLIDGRSVYDPLTGGVNWDVQNTVMQDLDRIEVIRGPAGALWGENAVNGVINIITRSAKDTQGLLITAIGGTEDRAFGDVRYGWKICDDAYARVYVKHFERDQTLLPSGAGGGDAWQMSQAGFRVDWQPSTDNRYTFHGDIYEGYENNHTPFGAPGTFVTSDANLAGGNVVGLWEHDLGGGSDLKLQMYYDRTHRTLPDSPIESFKYDIDTFDVDFQHHVHLDEAQEFIWGLGYRAYSDQVRNTSILTLEPNHRAIQIISLFAQYEFQIIKDRLRLTLGSKFEHNDFIGFEVQPNARLLLNIDPHQTAWAAVSRAVRAPTRIEEDLHVIQFPIPGAPPLNLDGNRGVTSETVLAYEVGYRVEPADRISLDVATFYNVYKHLLSVDNPNPATPFNFLENNDFHGTTYGIEVGATFKAADWWTIRAAYTYLKMELRPDPGSTDRTTEAGAGNSPNNQVYVRSSMNLPHNLEFDLMGRYVDQLTGFNPLHMAGTSDTVPPYISLDARLGWRPNEHLEISAVGQNLLDNQHPEFGGGNATRHEIPRSVYGMVTWRW
jgi:iron complex outermembrane receptor protein